MAAGVFIARFFACLWFLQFGQLTCTETDAKDENSTDKKQEEPPPVVNVTFQPNEKLGIKLAGKEGEPIVVDRVDADSQADRKGVKVGWVAVSIDSAPFSREQLKNASKGDSDFVVLFNQSQANAYRSSNVSEWEEKQLPFTLGWDANDPVEIYFAEFLLSRWVLDSAPWNAYHSGLGFVNNRTKEKVMYDYSPHDTASVMKKLVPQVTPKSAWRALLFGDVDVEWLNQGSMNFHREWPTHFTNLYRIARMRGSVANEFANWVKTNFTHTRTTFDTLEVLHQNGSHLRSTMCHDFVTDALWFFYDRKVRMRPETAIFRDHIIMYADSIEEVGDNKTARHRREFLRYFRLLRVFYTRIASQFTYGREALIVTWKLGLPVYFRTKGIDYRIKVQPPFLNYCYLPLAIPPKRHNLAEPNKLCALAMSANISNITVPFEPMPAGLSPEGRLDRDEAVGSLALVVLAAVLLVRPSKA